MLMTVAASLDPLYPLKARFAVSPLIHELVEIDIYQYMIGIHGKAATFRHLQARFEKVDRFGRRGLIVMCAIFAFMLALEIVGLVLGWLSVWLHRFQTGQVQATGGGATGDDEANQNVAQGNRANTAAAAEPTDAAAPIF